jgi:hypothetical protein
VSEALVAPELLLEAAAQVLRPAGFSVAIEPLEGSEHQWLVAENELFVLAAVAGGTLDELGDIEPLAAEAVLERLAGLDAGAKRWDAYLMLLTAQRWESIDRRERVELVYNTRGVRRLVGADLAPDDDGELRPALSRALRAFLPLGEPLGTALEDLDEALVRALVLNGVDRDAAPRYVAAYRAKGSLDDV